MNWPTNDRGRLSSQVACITDTDIPMSPLTDLERLDVPYGGHCLALRTPRPRGRLDYTVDSRPRPCSFARMANRQLIGRSL